MTSYVQCEQIRVVSSERLLRRVGLVDSVHMLRIENMLRRILAL